VGGHEPLAPLLAGAAQLLGAALVAQMAAGRRVALPKQWSKCQWVLTAWRHGSRVSRRRSASSSVASATQLRVSTTSTSSSPTTAPTFRS
jgi:hypothetical protein